MLPSGPLNRGPRCPQCGGVTTLDSSNPARPFCSERCKLLDLGAWFSGRYAIPAPADDAESEPDET